MEDLHKIINNLSMHNGMNRAIGTNGVPYYSVSREVATVAITSSTVTLCNFKNRISKTSQHRTESFRL